MANKMNDEWTFTTLRIYLEALTTSLENQLAARLHSQELAMSKAETAIEARLKAMNEFRGSLNDIVLTLLPRQEYDVNHRALEHQVAELSKRFEIISARLDVLTGKAGGIAQGWTVLVAILTMGIALYAMLK